MFRVNENYRSEIPTFGLRPGSHIFRFLGQTIPKSIPCIPVSKLRLPMYTYSASSAKVVSTKFQSLHHVTEVGWCPSRKNKLPKPAGVPAFRTINYMNRLVCGAVQRFSIASIPVTGWCASQRSLSCHFSCMNQLACVTTHSCSSAPSFSGSAGGCHIG